MTLLTIATAVADEVGVDRPTSVIGSPQTTAQQLLRYANFVGRRLMRRVAWQALRREKTFTSLASETQTAIIPSDFDRFVPETFWNRTDYELWTGPIGAVQWQGLKAQDYRATPRFAYRGDAVLVIPTPSAGKSLAFEYVSNLWCESSGGTGQSAWAADTDVGVLDEDLIALGIKYLYLTDRAQPTAMAARVEFEDYFSMLVENDQPDAGVMVAADIFGGGRHFTGAPPSSGSGIEVM